MTPLVLEPFLHGLDACRRNRGSKAYLSGSGVTRKHRCRKQRQRHSYSTPPSQDQHRSIVVYRATLEPIMGESTYCIHVMHRSGLRWKVLRTISEFGEFHDELAALLDADDSDLLPQLEQQVSWVPNFVQDLLSESCDQGLQSHGLQSMQGYLDQVLRVPHISQLEPVLRLLGVQAPEPPAGLRLAPRSWGHELEVRPSRTCSASEEGDQGPIDGYKMEIQHLDTGACFPITREVGWSGLLVQKAHVGQLTAGMYRFTVSAFNSAGESGTVSIVVDTSTNQPPPPEIMPQRDNPPHGDGPDGAVPATTLPAGGSGAAVHLQSSRRRRAHNCVHIDAQRLPQVSGPGTSSHVAVETSASLGTVYGGNVPTASEFPQLSLVRAFASGHVQSSANRTSQAHVPITMQPLPAETLHPSPPRGVSGDHMQGGIAGPQLHDHVAQNSMPAPRRYLRAQPNGGHSRFHWNPGAALPHVSSDATSPDGMMSQGVALVQNETSAMPLQQQCPSQAGNEVIQQENQRCAEIAAITEAPDRLASCEQMCVVCLTAPKTHAFVPCGHRCVCASCGSNLCRETRASCPVCRAPAQQLLHVFV